MFHCNVHGHAKQGEKGCAYIHYCDQTHVTCMWFYPDSGFALCGYSLLKSMSTVWCLWYGCPYQRQCRSQWTAGPQLVAQSLLTWPAAVSPRHPPQTPHRTIETDWRSPLWRNIPLCMIICHNTTSSDLNHCWLHTEFDQLPVYTSMAAHM